MAWASNAWLSARRRPLSHALDAQAMSSQHNKQLQQTLAPLLKAHGFTKEGPTWRKRFPESIAVFNIQGSQWGVSFYINLGIYFIALGQNERPLEYHCHVRARLDEVVPDRARCHAR